ncbi:MAG: hypothetical protein MZW92_67360, partial [Comamonadaceae bacterium]|nr:hypothetical protein [Comamonadaceae bacterium]
MKGIGSLSEAPDGTRTIIARELQIRGEIHTLRDKRGFPGWQGRFPGPARSAEVRRFLKRRSVLLFFVLPFLGVFVFFTLSSVLSQADLKRRTETLVRDQLAATAGILRTTVARYLDEGAAPGAVLDTLFAEEQLYFVALLDESRNVLAWNSRFEGYLPISLTEVRDEVTGIIDSPAGKIFSELKLLTTGDGRRFYLYLGYALTGMEEMIASSRRTAVLLAALILLAGALFFRGLYTPPIPLRG